MKKTVAFFIAAVVSAAFAFAGGIENKTNMSTGYLRNPSRNVESERPEASFYNIAGTAFMEPGLHIEVGNQFIIKEYLNKLNTNAFAAYGIKDGSEYNDETAVLLYPNVDLVYRWNNFAFFGNFGVYAGGGKLEYSEGTGLTALAFLDQAGQALAKGETTNAQLLSGAATDHSIEITSITYGEQIGLAYNFFDLFSVAAAVRFLEGSQDLSVTSQYFASLGNGGDEISCSASAFGVSPVFGAHVRLFEKLDIATQLQLMTKLEYDVSDVKGNLASSLGISSSKTFRTDISTVLNFGVGYRVIEPLYVSTSFNYYFNKAAECNSVIGETDYDDSFEFSLGADYRFNDFVLVSAGIAYSNQGEKDDANNVLNPVLDSFQIGFGAEITPIKILTITAGGTWVDYFDSDYYQSSYELNLSKNLFMFSLGATVKLF